MQQKKLKDVLREFSEMFPGLADTVLGIKDPMDCETSEETHHVIAENITLLKSRIAFFQERHPDMHALTQKFMSDKKNFSNSEWKGLKNFHSNVNLFRQSLQEKLTLKSHKFDDPAVSVEEIVKEVKKDPQNKKSKMAKTKKISRDRWLQA